LTSWPLYGTRQHRIFRKLKGITMPNENWGAKRICPETGKRFYDLNQDPVVSPYTGAEYPLRIY